MSGSALPNPFVGLRPFESADSLYYFGRKEQTRALLAQLHAHHFLAVVGSSGAGKSSLVRAGLIPNLEAGFLVQDRDLWRIAVFKPGHGPMANFARSLLAALDRPAAAEDADAFTEAIRRKGTAAVLERTVPALQSAEANLLLVADQFEELFRFRREQKGAGGREEGEAFVDLLLGLAAQADAPIFTCLTMRSDFLGDCDLFRGLPEAMNRSQYLVPRLTRNQRREAIMGPVRLSGADMAPRLMDRLLNESLDTRDDLPVLQHALMRTWSFWARNGQGPVDAPHYEAVGGVRLALNRHAEEAYAELDDAGRRIAEKMFQALAVHDEGNRRIRRPMRLNEVAAVCETPPDAVWAVVETFRRGDRNFLIPSAPDPAVNPLIDISHESFINLWNRLSGWVEEETESRRIYERLADAARRHAEGKGDLYQETDLKIAADWWAGARPTPEWAARYAGDLDAAGAFLEESRKEQERIRRRQEEEQAERERLLKEKAELMEKQAREQGKALRLTRIIILAVSLFTLVTIALALWALERSREAERKSFGANYNLTKVFEEKALKALDQAEADNDVGAFQEAVLYASAALEQEVEKGKTALGPASVDRLFDGRVFEAALAEKWSSPVASSHQVAVKSMAFSPDGKTLATGLSDDTVRLWDVASGAEKGMLKGHSAEVTSVAFNPDGKTMATGSWDHTVRLWDVATGLEKGVLKGHLYSVWSVMFSPDGETLASGADDNKVRLWDVTSGDEKGVLQGHTDSVLSVAYSPDGKFLASGSEDEVRLWSVADRAERNLLKEYAASVWSVAYSPDGKTLAAGLGDNTVRLWDVISGDEKSVLQGHTDSALSVAYSPDGKTLATGSRDHTVRLWDVATDAEKGLLKGHSDSVLSVAFSPDGKTLASGSYDNTVRLWDVVTGVRKGVLKGYTLGVVAFSPDGKTLSFGSDNTVRLWDVTKGAEQGVLQGHTDSVLSAAFSPDGKILATGSVDQTVRLWDVATGTEKSVLRGHNDSVLSMAFSPADKTLATGSRDNTVRLWDVAGGVEKDLLKRHSDSVWSVAFSPDGKTLASGSADNTVLLWDIRLLGLFPKNGKATTLFRAFVKGVKFLWQVELQGFEFKPVKRHFVYEKNVVFFNPSKVGQSKFDQVLEWAKTQVKVDQR